MQDFTTPMMKQYMEIKSKFQDCLLFYRMGDFYELFLDDAHIGAKILDIVLTSRAKGKDGRIPMAGVPYHAVDSYLSKLVKAGYKVAICEQVSEPNTRGIVDREVIRIVTPGTVLDDVSLREKENNYIISISQKRNTFGLSVADLSTGQFEIEELGSSQELLDEIKRLSPSECILSPTNYNSVELLGLLKNEKNMNISCFQQADHFANSAKKLLMDQFGRSVIVEEVKDFEIAQSAAAVLLGYLKYTQTDHVSHFKTLDIVHDRDTMQLDFATITNLELFNTLRTNEVKGTLLSHLDKTKTAMGGRLLKKWIKRPLISTIEITKRHEVIEQLLHDTELHQQIIQELEHIGDIERVITRLTLGIGNARDLIVLKCSLQKTIKIKEVIAKDLQLFKEIRTKIKEELVEIVSVIDKMIVDDPPYSVKEGGLIKDGVDKKIDYLREIVNGNSTWLHDLEIKERDRTGISNLKVRFNKVFGFYIEVSNSNKDAVPPDYMRKQTLVNGERFITSELKEKEEHIIKSEDEMQKYEYTLFIDLLTKILKKTQIIQQAAFQIAIIDCISSFATVSQQYHYVRPQIENLSMIEITEGRHPVVETMLGDDRFVPNSTYLDDEGEQLHIITGPNMAGKSVYIRQVALIVLLNQIGCFVPASKARLSLVDRIFVRSGASDMISEGLSTFMVEMVETAQIIQRATSKSLVVMDEIGRGTSTYDGISIAWAVAEYLVTDKTARPKTLFATHYHELQELESQHSDQIKNYHMAVEEEEGRPVFLYTLLPKGASHSYGIAVARLAGLPDSLIENAYKVLHSLETKETSALKVDQKTKEKYSYVDPLNHKLQKVDIDHMTPIEALSLLAKLKKEYS